MSKNCFFWSIFHEFITQDFVERKCYGVLPFCQPPSFLLFLYSMASEETLKFHRQISVPFWRCCYLAHSAKLFQWWTIWPTPTSAQELVSVFWVCTCHSKKKLYKDLHRQIITTAFLFTALFLCLSFAPGSELYVSLSSFFAASLTQFGCFLSSHRRSRISWLLYIEEGKIGSETVSIGVQYFHWSFLPVGDYYEDEDWYWPLRMDRSKTWGGFLMCVDTLMPPALPPSTATCSMI